MKHLTTVNLLAAPWLLPPGTDTAASAPAGGYAHGQGEPLLVDAYYPLLDFSYRLLKAF